MMYGIRARNTKAEPKVRTFLHGQGLRFPLHVGRLLGSPDLVFPKHRVVVLVHDCFRSRHSRCRLAGTQASNTDL